MLCHVIPVVFNIMSNIDSVISNDNVLPIDEYTVGVVLVLYKPHFHYAILSSTSHISPSKKKADWKSSHAGCLAPFLTAFASPL